MVDMVHVGVVDTDSIHARELMERLLRHPQVKITQLQSTEARTTQGEDLLRDLEGADRLPALSAYDLDALKDQCHAVFRCAGVVDRVGWAVKVLESGIRVFDFSSGFRYRTRDSFRKAHEGEDHPSPELNLKAVYGLPEFYRPDIIGSSLVAIPGNFPTAVLIALGPLLKRDMIGRGGVVVDCKGGTSTARCDLDADTTESDSLGMMTDPLGCSQDLPEIKEQLHRRAGEPQRLTMMTHVVPALRGTLCTCYVNLSEEIDDEAIRRLYQSFYNEESFVRILEQDSPAKTSRVIGTNCCDVSLQVDDGGHHLIITTALDNMVKGASGQAVQCFNISYSLDERLGLK